MSLMQRLGQRMARQP